MKMRNRQRDQRPRTARSPSAFAVSKMIVADSMRVKLKVTALRRRPLGSERLGFQPTPSAIRHLRKALRDRRNTVETGHSRVIFWRPELNRVTLRVGRRPYR